MRKNNFFLSIMLCLTLLIGIKQTKNEQLSAKLTAAASDYWGWSNTTSFLVGVAAVYGGMVVGAYFGGPLGARAGGFVGGL